MRRADWMCKERKPMHFLSSEFLSVIKLKPATLHRRESFRFQSGAHAFLWAPIAHLFLSFVRCTTRNHHQHRQQLVLESFCCTHAFFTCGAVLVFVRVCGLLCPGVCTPYACRITTQLRMLQAFARSSYRERLKRRSSSDVKENLVSSASSPVFISFFCLCVYFKMHTQHAYSTIQPMA